LVRALEQEVGEGYGIFVEELVDKMNQMARKGETKLLDAQIQWLKFRSIR